MTQFEKEQLQGYINTLEHLKDEFTGDNQTISLIEILIIKLLDKIGDGDVES